MRLCYLILIFCSFFLTRVIEYASAQSYLAMENNFWISGSIIEGGSGMHFSSGDPGPLSNEWRGSDGAATVSDAKGNLLFYTDGNIVWNRNHVPMPSGWDINNDGTRNGFFMTNNSPLSPVVSVAGFDAVAIVPIPGSPHRYYIFSIPKKWTGGWALWHGMLFYSIVDMSLDNGLGDVDPSARGVLMRNNLMESIEAVPGDNCNFWLITHEIAGNRFLVYEITDRGISERPVISPAGTDPHRYYETPRSWKLSASPDRKKIGLCVHQTDGFSAIYQDTSAIVEVSDFDVTNGIVSNTLPVPVSGDAWNLEFSPGSNFLYVSEGAEVTAIRQYDLNAAYPWAGVQVNPGNTLLEHSDMRLGPDGKIYLSSRYSSGMQTPKLNFRIEYPDQRGLACAYAQFATNLDMLFAGNGVSKRFPNPVPVMQYIDTQIHSHARYLCFDGDSIKLQASDTSGFDYLWDTGSTGSFATVFNEGVYVLTYKTYNPCITRIDSFMVEHIHFEARISGNAVSCDGSPVMLEALPADAGFFYEWADGITGGSRPVRESGDYTVSVSKSGCADTASVAVDVRDMQPDLGPDTLLCIEKERTLQLAVTAAPEALVQWSTGSSERIISITDSGRYIVEVTEAMCTGRDTIYVSHEYCECPVYMPNAFTPESDGRNDYFRALFPGTCNVSSFMMRVFDRWGRMVYSATDAQAGWDGTNGSVPCEPGSYFYFIEMNTGKYSKKVVFKGDVLLIR